MMNISGIPRYVGQAALPYGEGDYGDNAYGQTTTATEQPSTTTPTTGSNDQLANTGTGVWLLLAVSVSLIIVSAVMLVRFAKQQKQHNTEQQ